jgi:hypothetical protein
VPVRAGGVERSPETALMRTSLIRTNYQGAARDQNERVAISGPGVLGCFVVPSSREQNALVRQLDGRLGALEAAAVEEWKKTREPGSESVALTRTFRIDGSFGTRYVSSPPRNNRDVGLVRAETSIAGRSYYYLSSEKLFKLRPDGDCMMNLSSEGFVVAGRDRRILTERIASEAFAEYCGDRAESVDLLATIRIGDRHWWIMRSALEDGYDYGLLDPLSGAPVVLKGLWGTR